MAGEKLKGPFSYKVAKKILSQADLERLACAFLATENVYQVCIATMSFTIPFPHLLRCQRPRQQAPLQPTMRLPRQIREERYSARSLANAHQFDHNKAATEFGGSKPDSFKRQIWVITKKIKEEMAKGGGEDDVAETIEKPKAKAAPKKRKAADPEEKGKGKKAKVDLAVKAEGEGEAEGDDGDDYL